MNLLLLLSALLSALSGVGQAVRGVRVPAAVCASAAPIVATRVRRVTAARRPVMVLPIASRAVVQVFAALRLIPAEPIFAGRRRE